MARNILDISVNVGVSEFHDFADPLDINTDPDFFEEIYVRPFVGVPGAFFNSCHFCGALKLKPFSHPFPSPGNNTLYSMCCSKGKVDIEEESPTPATEYFVDLWSTDEIEGILFRKNARKINNAFSLTSYLFPEDEMVG